MEMFLVGILFCLQRSTCIYPNKVSYCAVGCIFSESSCIEGRPSKNENSLLQAN